MSIDALERKVQALLRVVNAQEHGTNGVFLTRDERGSTPEGTEALLTEAMAAKGLKRADLQEAGVPVRHANLHFLGSRRVGVTTKAQADAFLAGKWTPYSGEECPEPEEGEE